jgi:hypothetical protein
MNRARTDDPSETSENDDCFDVEFYPKKVKEPWRHLLETVFPIYIKAAKPYVGMLCDVDIFVSDIGTGDRYTGEYHLNPNYVDIRKGVYRIWPANYWDRELCECSFKLTPEEIVKRLENKVADCRVFEDGVLLIYSFEPVLGDEILKINEVLMPILRLSK